jgi:hypothetical protein
MLRVLLFCGGILAALSEGAMAGECQGRIGAETRIGGQSEYDPFAPADLSGDYRIAVTSTGGVPCSFGLVFRGRTARAQLGGVLSYEIANASGTTLLTAAPASMAPLARLGAPLGPSTDGAAEYQVVIPRGQFAAPGVYRDIVDLELYGLDDGGRPSGAALDTAPVAIAYTVPRVLSVNLRGGALTTTLAFGAMSEGKQRSVVIESRSNQTYQFDVTSERRGRLTLTPEIPGRDWSIGYVASFAGQPLDLSRTASPASQPPTRPESDASHPLTVTIGDVGAKRAGRYEDVITIEIKASVP